MLNAAQLTNQEYNLSQTQVGYPLKTLKGSTIKRSNFGVGKLIGGQLYFHKSYFENIFEAPFDFEALEYLEDNIPFEYNVIRWDIKKKEIVLVECPDFNEAREPVVGRMFSALLDGTFKTSRFFNQIYHHKWLWVDNSYAGFDVAESWEWSKEWLSVLTEPADGSNIINWEKQLARFGLE